MMQCKINRKSLLILGLAGSAALIALLVLRVRRNLMVLKDLPLSDLLKEKYPDQDFTHNHITSTLGLFIFTIPCTAAWLAQNPQAAEETREFLLEKRPQLAKYKIIVKFKGTPAEEEI